MKTYYIAWQDHQARRWYPIGRLCFDGTVYRFVYTRGAECAARFQPLSQMADLRKAYESPTLFPFLANRLLSKKRAEYHAWLAWIGCPTEEVDPLVLLAQTEGTRATDALQIFPCPEKNPDGFYTVRFFCHGIRYLMLAVADHIPTLVPGTTLLLMPDPQNPYDKYAVALRTADPPLLVGYCPRYLAHDVLQLLGHEQDTPKVTVVQVNPEAPMQLRLLCQLAAPWPQDFQPCAGKEYEPLV